MNAKSIFLGYTVLIVREKDDSVKCDKIEEICSVTGCLSENITVKEGTDTLLFDPILNGKDSFMLFSDLDSAKLTKKDHSGSEIFAIKIFPILFTEQGITEYDIKETKNAFPENKFGFIGFDLAGKGNASATPGCSPFTCNNYAEKYCKFANKFGLINTYENAVELGKILGKEQPEDEELLLFEVYREKQ